MSQNENDNILWSGGALGADSEWAHLVYVSSFDGHKIKGYSDATKMMVNSPELSKHFLATADALNRPKSNSNKYVLQLLYRDVYLAHQVDTLYAVGFLTKTGDLKPKWQEKTGFYGQIERGTAWSCQAFINEYLQEEGNEEGYIPLYFFDQTSDSCTWMQPYISKSTTFPFKKMVEWRLVDGVPPRPSGIYGGIGSRDLTPSGQAAIQSVFEEK